MGEGHKKQKQEGFIGKLIGLYLQRRKLHPREVCIFNVITNFGSYQIIIGPEYMPSERRELHIKPHSRKLEINGSMHHLFIKPKKVSALPEHDDVKMNMRGTVIMKEVAVHIVDRDGSGAQVDAEDVWQNGVVPNQRINLAGEDGESMIERYIKTGRLAMETYRIIQEDILRVLKK